LQDIQFIQKRLTRIEGQVRGIEKMVEENRECEDIIIQLSAVGSAVTNVAKLILENHIDHCLIEDLEKGDREETLKNLKKAINQFSKMK